MAARQGCVWAAAHGFRVLFWPNHLSVPLSRACVYTVQVCDIWAAAGGRGS
jgi:hypothetical protein